MKTNLIILGVGRWGTHLVRIFSQNPQVNILAIVDNSPELLQQCKQKLLANYDLILATQWQEVRQLEGIDAVIIATPASTHYQLIGDALELGYHVFVEKPLTLDPQECRELCQLAAAKQRYLFVDHTYLFNAAVTAGQPIIQSGKIGQLRYGYATRTHLSPVRQDVDVLWDLVIHDLAIFNYWLGQFPVEVQAMGNSWLQNNLADLVWVILTYPNGFKAYIHLCWLNPDKQRRLCVVGSEGTLIFDELSRETPLTIQTGSFRQENEYFIPINRDLEVIDFEPNEPLKKVCEHFLSNIQCQNYDSFSDGWEGTRLVEVLTALSQSLQQEGKVIKLLKINSD
jgi:predicted dehydrogenase